MLFHVILLIVVWREWLGYQVLSALRFSTFSSLPPKGSHLYHVARKKGNDSINFTFHLVRTPRNLAFARARAWRREKEVAIAAQIAPALRAQVM